MLEIHKRRDGIVVIQADGQLTTDEYIAFVGRFGQLVRNLPTAMRIEVGPAFTGWNPAALWRDLKLDYQHGGQFGRVAIVGDRRWEAWATELFDPDFPGEVRFFEQEEDAEAEEFLRSDAGAQD